jgi:Tol biopolymer transport system component/DNA-binding winged helix-turn-helix (wHTH) protein
MVVPPETRPSAIRFGSFELNVGTGELSRDGSRLKLHGQPIALLALLLEKPGELVTREELRQRLWSSDTFVDFEHGLNAAVRRLRAALGDDADAPRYIETVPRRGYRWIAPVASPQPASGSAATATAAPSPKQPLSSTHRLAAVATGVALTLVAAGSFVAVSRLRVPQRPPRTLTRATFEPDFQHSPTWSPDGRSIAYGSSGPTRDVWVQLVAGGSPVQLTTNAARDWQPDWSPDGAWMVFRSEREGGGLYTVPALGGQDRKLTTFGYYPRWSPDGSQILFAASFIPTRLYVVGLDGAPPREVAPELCSKVRRVFANWHPDGRVSIMTALNENETEWELWTVAVSGASPVRSELAPAVARRYQQAALELPVFDFDWSPSGDAIVFSAAARGVRNIWKVTVDPRTLRWVAGPEQLTLGAGDDLAVAVSPDGKKLAFNIQTAEARLWTLPFDASAGHAIGPAQPLTPEGWRPLLAGLSADGRKLAFVAQRRGEQTGRSEIWEKRLDGGSDRLLQTAAGDHSGMRWSPDGTHLAYSRDGKVLIHDTQTQRETPLASAAGRQLWVTDWSADGRLITAEGPGQDTKRSELWSLPVTTDGAPAGPVRQTASHRDYSIAETAVSPDGRWICFEAIAYPRPSTAQLYLVRSSGGPWIPVTDGGHWDDKPRWAPNGKTLYFLSNRGSEAIFFQTWSVRIDPETGRTVSVPSQVATAEVPGHFMSLLGATLAIAPGRLVLAASSISGNVWVLDGLDR